MGEARRRISLCLVPALLRSFGRLRLPQDDPRVLDCSLAKYSRFATRSCRQCLEPPTLRDDARIATAVFASKREDIAGLLAVPPDRLAPCFWRQFVGRKAPEQVAGPRLPQLKDAIGGCAARIRSASRG